MWEDYNPSSGMDLIIPGKNKGFVSGACKVLKTFDQKTLTGKTFPVISLEATGGKKFLLAVWARDAKPLIEAWGLPKTEQAWEGRVCDVEVDGAGRLVLTPLHSVEEQVKA